MRRCLFGEGYGRWRTCRCCGRQLAFRTADQPPDRCIIVDRCSSVNIYLKMEIKARELEGRLLLGMVAAERGHTVLLGEMRPVVRDASEVPPGVYHDTSLYPGTGQLRLRDTLIERGWMVTSQDEEHGLLEPTYDNYARKRYSSHTMSQAARVFTWGPHDSDALSRSYPEYAPRVEAVGSPRIDLCDRRLDGFFRGRQKPGLDPARPYVLFANNFTRVIGVNRIHTFVRHMRWRDYFEGDDDAFEFLQYEEAAAQMDFLPHMIRAIRCVASHHPELTVVVRPHPQETEEAWRDLIGEVPNVLVSAAGEIGRWVRSAQAVIQSGDTTAFEATVAGVPLITFAPMSSGHHWGDRYANRFGLRAESVEEVLLRLSEILYGQRDYDTVLDRDRRLLRERIRFDPEELASERIVAAWEAASAGRDLPHSEPDEIIRSSRRARSWWRAREVARPLTSKVRRVGGAALPGSEVSRTPYLTAQKFPPITRGELDELAAGYRASFDRFHSVQVARLGPRLVCLSLEGSD